MGRPVNWGNFLLLAIGSALYPLLLGAVIAMLEAPKPFPLLSAYLAGGAIMSVGIGIIILVLVDDTDAFTGSSGSTTRPAADIVLGGLLVVVALLMVTGRDRRLRARRRGGRKTREEPQKESWTRRYLARGPARLTFFVGMALSLPSVYYLSALKDIDTYYGVSATAIGLILIFNAIQFTLIEVPLVGYLVAPDATKRGVGVFNEWLRTHARQIGEVAAGAIGLYLIVRGVIDLTS